MRPRVEVCPAREPGEIGRSARRAAEVLAAGGVVVHPTETVYGLGGDGSEASNALIARIKLRARDQPMIILVPDVASLRAWLPGVEWPAGAEALARRFWPGPLTLIVRCAGAPAALRGQDDGVAVRVSPHPVVRAMLACWKRPLTSSSANLSGGEPALTLERALDVFRDRRDLEDVERPVLGIDAGATPGTTPSSIVSFASGRPRLVREGPVRAVAIRECVPDLSVVGTSDV